MLKTLIIIAVSLVWTAYVAVARPAEAAVCATAAECQKVCAGVEGCQKVVVASDQGGQMAVVVRTADEPGAKRGWLGVALMETTCTGGPPAAGVKVSNVVQDSPAAKAGLQVDDVILSVNDQAVSGAADLAARIREIGPGHAARLGVERAGQRLELTATLAESSPEQFQWLQAIPGMNLEDRLIQRGRIMQMGPDGRLTILPFADAHAQLGQLSEEFGDLLGKLSTTARVSIEDGKTTLQITTAREDGTLEIEQEGDGPITVRRKAEGQTEFTTTEYATPDALRAADPEAADIYDHTHTRAICHVPGPDGKMDIDVTTKLGDIFEQNLSGPLGGASQALEEAYREFAEQTRKLGAAGGTPPAPFLYQFGATAVTRSFRVNPDGQIELTARKGDAEVVNVYRDETDLQTRNPEAYARYRDVLDSAAAED